MKIIFGLSFSIYFILSLIYIFYQIITGVLFFGFEGGAGSYLATLPFILGSWWLLWKNIFKIDNFFDINKNKIFKIAIFSFTPILSFLLFASEGSTYSSSAIFGESLDVWYLYYSHILIFILWLSSQALNFLFKNKIIQSIILITLCITSFFSLQIVSHIYVAKMQNFQEPKSKNMKIYNISDYDLLTLKGNKIGIVLEYDIIFEKEIDRNIYYGMGIINSYESSVENKPEYISIVPMPSLNNNEADRTKNDLYSQYSYIMEPGISYHVKEYFLISSQESKDSSVKPVSNTIDIEKTCLNNRYIDHSKDTSHTETILYSHGYKINQKLSRSYDISEYYKTIKQEGVKACVP